MSLPTRIGRYDIVELIGRGGMGAVYRGRDAVLERDVAIKMMSTEYGEDEVRRARFYREARAAAKLQHRNIITIFEFGEHDAHPYMVMEFLKGMDLQRRMRTGPPLSLDQKLDIAIGLLSGLGLAHQNGVIHRDVKPANVWVQEDGSVKLLDFGIAKLGASTSTSQGGVLGTVAYMSPEQVSAKVLDGRSDVFSAGVVFYELLSGRKPFDGETVTEVMVGIIERQPPPIPDLPEALAGVLAHALEKNPDQRYQTAFEFASDLQLLRSSLRPDTGSLPRIDLPIRNDGVSRTLTGQTSLDIPLRSGQTEGASDPPAAQAGVRNRWPLLVGGILVAVVLVAVLMRWRSTQAPGPGLAAEPGSDVGRQPVTAAAAATPLTLTTVPPGATAVLDGVTQPGQTPMSLAAPARYPVRLQLTLPGHQPYDREVSQAQWGAGTLAWTFVPAVPESSIVVEADYEVQVFRGGRAVGEPATVQTIRARGGDVITLRAPSVFLDQSVTLPARLPASYRLTPPATGSLSVRTNLETCEITIDGRSAGFPPLADQAVAAGSHILNLKCPDGQGLRQALTVSAGSHVVALCHAAGCQVQIR